MPQDQLAPNGEIVRTDPDTGEWCTLSKLHRAVEGRYSKAEIDRYWNETMIRGTPAGWRETIERMRGMSAGSKG